MYGAPQDLYLYYEFSQLMDKDYYDGLVQDPGSFSPKTKRYKIEKEPPLSWWDTILGFMIEFE